MRCVIAAVLLSTVFCSGCATAADSLPRPSVAVAVVTYIVDGDTFYVQYITGGEGLPTKIRPYLIDTPETTRGKLECFGPEATFFAWQLLFGRTVWLKHYGRETTDSRLLAFVYLDSQELSLFQAIVVAQGFACIDLQHEEERPLCVTMQALEDQAKSLRLGLWAACQPMCDAPKLCQNP